MNLAASSLRDVQPLRQTAGTHAVDDAEVDRLGGPAHRAGDLRSGTLKISAATSA